MSDPRLETALRQMEATANSFAVRLIRSAQVRVEYVEKIREMSQSIRSAVETGELSAHKGAEIANQMRNQIMDMQRSRDFDLGRSLAHKMKGRGISLEESISRAMKKFELGGKPFNQLSSQQQRQILMEVIDSAGRSRPAVTAKIPRLRWAGRGLWLATFAIAAYNIGTAENPWWQTGRESASIAGGLGGGFAGGAAMGSSRRRLGRTSWGRSRYCGRWHFGSAAGRHVYVEAAGSSDPTTRNFIARFTSFWSGTDEVGLARALASEQRTNPAFVQRVFLSLNDDFNTDADDVAREYVKIAHSDSGLSQALRNNLSLRNLLIQLMDNGWTSAEEQTTIGYLRNL